MYEQQLNSQHRVWRHVKTNSLYYLIGVAKCSTNSRLNEASVIYFSIDYQHLTYREINEFLDGRFIPEPPAKV